MCGIFGFNLRRPLTPQDIDAGLTHLNALSHRGPDGQGHASYEDQGVFIGHRRLAILDTSDRAAQPMIRDGLTLAHNGEIYNFVELRNEMEKVGTNFSTSSDTEVVINSWRRDGAKSLHKFDGMFAFALFDGEVTHLATDPFGEKPLYVIENDEGVYYSSEPAPLIEMLGLKFEPTETEIAAFLTLGFIPAPQTGFGKLQLLQPGTHAVVSNGRLNRVSRYWTVESPRLLENDPRPISEPELDDIAQALIESTRVRLRSDVPTSIFLSSGVDSALIAAIVSRELISDIPAITVGFPEVDVADESEGAAAIAKHLGVEHEVVLSDGTSGSDPLDLMLSVYGCANDNVTAIPAYEMARAARASATVALSGIGGDELFYGYNKYQVFYERRRLLAQREPARTLARWLYKMNDRRTGSYISQLIRRSSRWTYANLKNVGAWDILEQIPELEKWGDDFFSESDTPQYVAARHFDLTQVLPCLYIPAIERASMRVGLEVRTPFLNKKLFSTVDKLDPRSVVGFGQKNVARRLLARYLPEDLIFSGKRGFNSPLAPIVQAQEATPFIPGLDENLVAKSRDRRLKGRGGNLFIRMMILSRLAEAN